MSEQTASRPPQNVADLEETLSRPPADIVEFAARLPGDILILGAGGKMGPSLAWMLKRAVQESGTSGRIVAVSRFSDAPLRARLEQQGIETISCDLLDRDALMELPEVPNVFFLAGRKLGSSGNESLTWGMNTHLPAVVCEKFRRSRIVVFSTGNVYGMTEPRRGGSVETDPLQPVGEYAMSCLGRERIFEYFCRQWNIPMTFLRINYATELRYGVLVDLAQQITAEQPIDLSMGFFNTIWLAEANRMAALSLDYAQTPPEIFNVTGGECLSVRETAGKLTKLLNRKLKLSGEETTTALLSNASKAINTFGRPKMGIDEMIGWVADWVGHGRSIYGKPTHFQARDGIF